MFSNQSTQPSQGFISQLRTLFSLKASHAPNTGDMVQWMHQLNREIPGLDTLVVRLEKVEKLKSDMDELANQIRSFSTLYERICADYAELLKPLTDNEVTEDKAKSEEKPNSNDKAENVEVLPAEVVEKIEPLRQRLIGSSQKNGQKSPQRNTTLRQSFGTSQNIKYNIKFHQNL